MPADIYTRTETFPGTGIDHFRALMQRFLREGWTSATGERLLVNEERQTRRELVGIWPSTVKSVVGDPMVDRDYREVDVTPPTRGSWSVMIFGEEADRGHACIEAYQESNLLRIDFLDGQYPGSAGADHPPIGEPFRELSQMIIREVLQLAGPTEDEAWRSPTPDRDEEILRYFSKGLLYDAIADKVNCSVSTVERTLRRLGKNRYRKRGSGFQ